MHIPGSLAKMIDVIAVIGGHDLRCPKPLSVYINQCMCERVWTSGHNSQEIVCEFSGQYFDSGDGQILFGNSQWITHTMVLSYEKNT